MENDNNGIARTFLNGLLNYGLFAQLTLTFWYGTGALHSLVILGTTSGSERVPRAALGVVVSSAVEILAAIYYHELSSFGKKIRRRIGYWAFYVFSRLYNYVMGMANIFLFSSVQVFYEEYVGVEGVYSLGGNVRWAVGVLIVIWSLRISRTHISSPFFVCIDSSSEKNWFDFALYFDPERTSRRFSDRLLDAIFSVTLLSAILDAYWFTLTFTFDLLVYPSNLAMSAVASCCIAYVIMALVKSLTEVASDASVGFEETGRDLHKLIVEDAYIFGANFSTILLWKGLSTNAQLASEFIGPLLHIDPLVMAVYDQILAFIVMSILGVTCLLVFKGPAMDGQLTNGQDIVYSTQYLNIEQPHEHEE